MKNYSDEVETIHIHKVCQMQKCNYATVRRKYAKDIDSRGFIPTSIINDKN